jgi:hypothetical protein
MHNCAKLQFIYFIFFPSRIEVESFRRAEDTDYIVVFYSEDGSSSFIRSVGNKLNEFVSTTQNNINTYKGFFQIKCKGGYFEPV